jgi:hypothetical protein
MIRQQNERMKQAAGELRFETAGKIKAFIDQLSKIGKGAYRHARPMRDFAFVTVQPGPAARTAKLFLVLPGWVEEIADLIAEPGQGSEILRTVFLAAEGRGEAPLDRPGVERIGIAAHHLFWPGQSQGVFIPLAELADLSGKALGKAYRTAIRAQTAEESESEGVMKELQAM